MGCGQEGRKAGGKEGGEACDQEAYYERRGAEEDRRSHQKAVGCI
jgi:hypothetical protein